MSQQVSASRIIKASPDTIFDLLSDANRHIEFDGSGTLQQTNHAPKKLSLGSTFSMKVKLPTNYNITITVIAFEENKVIAWHHWARHIWRYDLADNSDGTTTVTESWDWSHCTLPVRLGMELVGFPKKNLDSIKKTLIRISEIVE